MFRVGHTVSEGAVRRFESGEFDSVTTAYESNDSRSELVASRALEKFENSNKSTRLKDGRKNVSNFRRIYTRIVSIMRDGLNSFEQFSEELLTKEKLRSVIVHKRKSWEQILENLKPYTEKYYVLV